MESSQRIIDAVCSAKADGQKLHVTGHASKRNWLPEVSAQQLVTTEHTGIVSYDPTELVVTVRAGTPIREVLSVLAQSNQTLAFEPPQFFAAGTIGGMVASGLSGPARPWGGSLRDAVLGVSMVNGAGEVLHFGGQVMKNVAGYDVSRLMAGSFGSLGVLLEVSLRVQPTAASSQTLAFALDAQAANGLCRSLARQYLPVNGTWWHNGQLQLRLAGSEAAVNAAAETLEGKPLAAPTFWQSIADHSHDFFKSTSVAANRSQDARLWRLVVPPAGVLPEVPATDLACGWAGGERWLWHEDADFVQSYATEVGGWAWCLGHAPQINSVQQKLMGSIKQSFDPEGVFASALNFESDHAH